MRTGLVYGNSFSWLAFLLGGGVVLFLQIHVMHHFCVLLKLCSFLLSFPQLCAHSKEA